MIDFSFNTKELKIDGEQYGQIHGGFYDYLFVKEEKNRDKSTSQEIIEKVSELLQKHPTFDVYFTGHSLGAALSTLMAFRAALDTTIEKPIMNISFASPFVRDKAFLDSFQKLQEDGKLRHLRISNEDDIVPLMPFASYTGTRYYQTGINVRLYNKKPWRKFWYRIFYNQVGGSKKDDVVRVLSNNVLAGITFTTPLNHLIPEYHKHFEHAKKELQKLELTAMYDDLDIVGPDF